MGLFSRETSFHPPDRRGVLKYKVEVPRRLNVPWDLPLSQETLIKDTDLVLEPPVLDVTEFEILTGYQGESRLLLLPITITQNNS